MGFQSIPGSGTGRLWFKLDEGIRWIPVSLNPYTDPDMTFTYESILESPWIYAGTKGIKKAWKSLTLFVDNDSTHNSIYIDYKLDDETDSWTTGTTSINPNPIAETDFASTISSIPVGYRIKYRIRWWQKNPDGNIAKIKAIIINCFGIAPIKHGYSFLAHVADDYNNNTLQVSKEIALGYSERVETAIAKADAWAQALTPLTMRSSISVIDNKTVLMKDPHIMLLKYNADSQVEEHLLQLTVHDL